MKKIALALALAFCCGIAFAGETKTVKMEKKKAAAVKTADAKDWQKKIFTINELKKYNGKDGMPVYAAVNGIVYDFSKAPPWMTGKHKGLHDAGTDLTDAFMKKAPKFHRDNKVLDRLPKVGILKTEGDTK